MQPETRTGAELRSSRRAAGLTQTELAALAGCRRGVVAYWERKQVLDRGSALVRRLAQIVGMYDYASSTRSGARACAGWSVTPDATPVAQPDDAAWSAKLAALEAQTLVQETRRHKKDLRRQAAWEAGQEVRCHAATGRAGGTARSARAGALWRTHPQRHGLPARRRAGPNALQVPRRPQHGSTDTRGPRPHLGGAATEVDGVALGAGHTRRQASQSLTHPRPECRTVAERRPLPSRPLPSRPVSAATGSPDGCRAASLHPERRPRRDSAQPARSPARACVGRIHP